jgi:hypothetical protein
MGRRDQLDDHLVGDQRPTPPVARDVAEQPVLDLVPLGGAWREMAHRHLKARLGREPRQLGLPGPDPVAVAATGIGGHQQPLGLGIGDPADPLPPAPQRGHRERGRVMVGPHAHPASVSAQVVDPVGDRLANLGVGEVVHPDPLGLTGRLPLGTAIGVPANQFLLLGIDRHHRLPGGQVRAGLLVT